MPAKHVSHTLKNSPSSKTTTDSKHPFFKATFASKNFPILYKNERVRKNLKYALASAPAKVHQFRKARHAYHLSNLATQLHALGVPTAKHFKELNVTEEQIQEAENQVQAHESFSTKEHRMLTQTFELLSKTAQHYSAMEESLWGYIMPLTSEAFRAANYTMSIQTLQALHELSKKRYDKNVKELEEKSQLVHSLLLGSVYIEHGGSLNDKEPSASGLNFMVAYPQLLSSVQLAAQAVDHFKTNWDLTEESRASLLNELTAFLDLFQSDTQELVNDIFHAQRIRLRAFDWVVDAYTESKASKKKTKTAEWESEKLREIASDYIRLHDEHRVILNYAPEVNA